MENSEVNKSVEKDIVAKFSVEEMMKALFADFTIVWHDLNVNDQGNQEYVAQLKKFCDVLTFTEWKEASTCIKVAKKICHVITSEELLVKEIAASQNVANIYILCGNNVDDDFNWTQNYKNVSHVETTIEDVLSKIQQNLLQSCQEALDIPAFAPIPSDFDQSKMNHILNFENRGQAKEDFLNLSKALYPDEENAKSIEEFQQNYNEYDKSQALKWFTRDSFFEKVTNNCLRSATADSVQYCRLPLKDMKQGIKQQYQTKSKNFSGLLYRGANISQEEWSNWKQNQDKEIEMYGFLSVSKKKKVALDSIKTDPSKKVLITIIVPKGPNGEEQGFAEMEEYSEFPEKQEILFNFRSRFTVLEAEDNYNYSGISKCRHLVLLYGAPGFRRFMTEKNPIQEVSILNKENILCAHCPTKSETLFFASIVDSEKENKYYCKACIDHGVAPFLCISATEKIDNIYTVKIPGYCLEMNSGQERVPFYGYKCNQCQAKKQNAYFVCADCDKKWCDNCFEEFSKCKEIGHHIILETNPFSFWCGKMPANELNDLKPLKNPIQQGGTVFEQATICLKSHEYEKAIEYYNLYIRENETKGNDVYLAMSYHLIGESYQNQREYGKALEHYLKSLDIEKCIHREDNRRYIATTYDKIGLVYSNLGDHKKTLEYFFKSLDIKKSIYGGENHAEIATVYKNIGLVYQYQKKYQKELKCYLKSLEIYKSVYEGENHPDIAFVNHNIGLAYSNRGEYKKALQYYWKSLDLKKSIHGGENHADIATVYKNIGLVYQIQEKYHKALKYYQKSLDIDKSIYGHDNNTNIASLYEKIASVYQQKGKYHKALDFRLKSLEIYKSSYGGDNHIQIATTYNNIGSMYSKLGECNRALEYYLKCLDLKKSIFKGENHIDIVISYFNIGAVYQKKGEYHKALEYYLKSLDINKSIDGRDNQNLTGRCYNAIGLLYNEQGDNQKALEYYLKSLDVDKSFYGNDSHPSIAASYDKVGSVYQNQRNYEKALEYYLKSLDIKKLIHGEKIHIDIAKSYYQIGLLYAKQGNPEKALEFYFRTLDISKSLHGNDNHIDIITIYKNIGNAYSNQGEYNKTLEYYLKSLKSLDGQDKNHAIGYSYERIGLMHTSQGEYSKALEFYSKSQSAYGNAHIATINIQDRIYEIRTILFKKN